MAPPARSVARCFSPARRFLGTGDRSSSSKKTLRSVNSWDSGLSRAVSSSRGDAMLHCAPSLVFPNSGGLLKRWRWRLFAGDLWRRGGAAPLPPESGGQMGRDGRFSAKSRGEREVLGKKTLRERPPQAAGRRLRAPIPEAGGDGWAARGTVGEDGPREEGQCRQSLASLGRVDKGAGSTEHLLGGQGQLLHRPAILIEGVHTLGGEGERRGEQQGVAVARIVHGDPCKGGAVGRGVTEHQGIPDPRAQRDPVVLPGLGAVRRGGGQ